MKAAVEAYLPYVERELSKGTRLHAITRHMLGLFRAVPGARAFRRHLSTHAVKPDAGIGVLRDALALVVDTPVRFDAHRSGVTSPRRATFGAAMFSEFLRASLPCSPPLIVAGALVTGLLAGLFGVGGGGVIVPVLYEIFRVMQVPDDVRMQLCVGTSLAIIIPTSIRSFRAHRAKRDLPVEILRQWALPVTVGVLIGGVIAAFAPACHFQDRFRRDRAVDRREIPVRKRDAGSSATRFPGPFLMNVYGLIIGLYSALMGVGGGSVSNAILVFYGQPIHAAVGIASGIGVLISIVGTIGFMIAGWPHQAMMPALVDRLRVAASALR